MGMEGLISNILPGSGGLVDGLMGNLTSGVNAFNSLLIGQGLGEQNKALTAEGQHTQDVGHWGEQRATDFNNERRAEWQRNMSGYGDAAEGRGSYAGQMRDAYATANEQSQAAVDYADQNINPLLKNAQSAFDTAQSSYAEQKAKLAQATIDTVDTAKAGLDRTLSFGQQAIDSVTNIISSGINAVAGSMKATMQDAETQAQQAEANGQPGLAASIRQRAAFTGSEMIGNKRNELVVAQSQLKTSAIQEASRQAEQATSVLAQAISTSATGEAGATADQVRNIISAASLGIQAGGLAVAGPLAARFEQIKTGIMGARDIVAGQQADVAQIERHAGLVDNFLGNAEAQRMQDVYQGANLALGGAQAVFAGHVQVASALARVQMSYTPSWGDFTQSFAQNKAANDAAKDQGGGFGWSDGLGLGMAGAATASLFA